MNSDGTNQTNLSNHPGDDMVPCPSHDGERILFKSNRDDPQGKYSLYTIRPDGTDLTLLGGSWVGGISCEGWSPDSTSFVFSEGLSGGKGKLMVVTISGQMYSPEPFSSIEEVSYERSAWSNTGDMIAYYRGGESTGVYQSDIYGNTPNIVFERPFAEDWTMVWSPNDTELAVGLGGEIFIQPNVNYAPKVNITNHPGKDGIAPGAWNSSGTKLVFLRDDKLHLMNPDGSAVVALGEGHRRSSFPAWSPDDTRLVYTCSPEGQEEICIIDVDGSNGTQLTNYPNSPDHEPKFVP